MRASSSSGVHAPCAGGGIGVVVDFGRGGGGSTWMEQPAQRVRGQGQEERRVRMLPKRRVRVQAEWQARRWRVRRQPGAEEARRDQARR